MLRCVCGLVVADVEDLVVFEQTGDTKRLRCRNRFCALDEVMRVTLSKKNVEVQFSRMFTDFNLLMMGRDMLEKSFEALAKRVGEHLGVGKSLKTRIKF